MRLRGVVRSTDLLARQGGDEFLILLTDLESDPRMAAEAVAKQVEAALLEPFSIADAEFEIGSSIGISIYPHDANDADTLLRHADAAMYEVKQAGARRDRLLRRRLAPHAGAAVADVASCAARCSATTSSSTTSRWSCPRRASWRAFEALVRWQDAERGIVGPNEFIPLAEDAGLIEAIGGWVLNAVCAQLREWAVGRSRRARARERLAAPAAPARLPDDGARGAGGRGPRAERADAGDHRVGRDARRRAREPGRAGAARDGRAARDRRLRLRALVACRACATCRSRC